MKALLIAIAFFAALSLWTCATSRRPSCQHDWQPLPSPASIYTHYCQKCRQITSRP